MMVKVLFVCLGNICRSPLAEGLFKKYIEKNDLHHSVSCDSAGMASYHTGELADKRTRKNAASHGIDLTHRARTFRSEDFTEFDYIIPMDRSNLEEIMKMKPERTVAQIKLMREFDHKDKGASVPDPYYGSDEDFEEVFRILDRSTDEFLNYIIEQHSITQ